MSKILRLAVCAVLLGVALARLGAAPESTGYFEAIKHDPTPVVGHTYYLRHCFKYEHGVSLATNYWRGTLVPINTKVKLVAKDGKMMVLRIGDLDEDVKIENTKFTRVGMDTIARRMLSPTPISFDHFDRDTIAAIKNGILQLGMTREQVVMARGYPPAHKTPSLDLNIWKYWSSRFFTQTIVFHDGVLTRGRGIE